MGEFRMKFEVKGRLDTVFLEFQFVLHFFYCDFEEKYASSAWTGVSIPSL